MFKSILGIVLSLVITSNVFAYENYGSALAAAEADGKNLVVAFTATWCGPCRQFKGTTLSDPEVKKELANNFHFYMVDTDEEPALAKKFGISSLPTTKIIDKNEKVLDTKIGVQNKSQFLNWLSKFRK